MKIVELKAENIKRLVAVQIRPGLHLVGARRGQEHPEQAHPPERKESPDPA